MVGFRLCQVRTLPTRTVPSQDSCTWQVRSEIPLQSMLGPDALCHLNGGRGRPSVPIKLLRCCYTTHHIGQKGDNDRPPAPMVMVHWRLCLAGDGMLRSVSTEAIHGGFIRLLGVT